MPQEILQRLPIAFTWVKAGNKQLVNLLPNFQKEVMTGSQSLKEGYLERGGELFQGVQFLPKKIKI